MKTCKNDLIKTNKTRKSKEKDIVFIVGYAGSGKSHLSNDYEKKGYYLISTDEIIRYDVSKETKDSNPFLIYNEKLYETVKDSYNKFIDIVQDLIKKKNKVVIEGQLHAKLIKDIVCDIENIQVILVKPKNKTVYLKHLTKRFESDPENYGRIGWMRIGDEAQDKIGLKDYLKNGIKGKIIKKLLKNASDARYFKHKELQDYYKKHFKLKVHLSL